MKLLVCGGRDFNGRNILFSTLDAASLYGGFTEIICGYDPENRKFQGADQLAYEWAMQADFPCACFPADWTRFGRSAGPRRNTQMAMDRPDECLAFPRANGTWGGGTLNMIGQCTARGIKVTQMRPEDLNYQLATASDAAQVDREGSRDRPNPSPPNPTPKSGEEL